MDLVEGVISRRAAQHPRDGDEGAGMRDELAGKGGGVL